MDSVGSKVRRAEGLLASLASEKDRWLGTSTSFQVRQQEGRDSLVTGVWVDERLPKAFTYIHVGIHT